MNRHNTTKYFLFFSFLYSIAIITLVILASNIVDAADPTAQPIITPIPGGQWGGVGELYGMFPNARNNSEILCFIDANGLGDWYSEKAYSEIDRDKETYIIYRYIYLKPANNNSIKMVFLINTSGARGEEVVLWTRIINASEALPPLNKDDIANLTRIGTPSVLPGNETNQNATVISSSISGQSNSIPGFTGVVAAISILLVIICKKKRQT